MANREKALESLAKAAVEAQKLDMFVEDFISAAIEVWTLTQQKRLGRQYFTPGAANVRSE